MSGIYIPMEMPKSCDECPCFSEYDACDVTGSWKFADEFDKGKERLPDCPLVPVPDREQILRVLKTERECVSRNCDRDCGNCDLSLERSEILKTYNALIAMLDPADKEGSSEE